MESCSIFTAIRSSKGYAIVRRTGSTNGYNNRLQPTLISCATPTTTLFSLGYGYGPANQNNGNPSTVVNNLIGASGRSQTFTYDALNRI